MSRPWPYRPRAHQPALPDRDPKRACQFRGVGFHGHSNFLRISKPDSGRFGRGSPWRLQWKSLSSLFARFKTTARWLDWMGSGHFFRLSNLEGAATHATFKSFPLRAHRLVAEGTDLLLASNERSSYSRFGIARRTTLFHRDSGIQRGRGGGDAAGRASQFCAHLG